MSLPSRENELPLGDAPGGKPSPVWPPQVAKDAIETAVVTHGNLGYSTEMPLQQWYRDVSSYLIADGTAAIQKRIIGASMFGKVAALVIEVGISVHDSIMVADPGARRAVPDHA